jgi:hypothetical protein
MLFVRRIRARLPGSLPRKTPYASTVLGRVIGQLDAGADTATAHDRLMLTVLGRASPSSNAI